jgi:hypothetical protein
MELRLVVHDSFDDSKQVEGAEHEERWAQPLGMMAQGNSGDTARRRQHPGEDFLRLRFWLGLRGRQQDPRNFAGCGNRPVRCRL